MPILLRPIATRMFLFLYILGIASSIITVPDIPGAKMYDNAPWELFIDIYVVCTFVCLIPHHLRYKNTTIPLRSIVQVIIYVIAYTLYVIDTFCWVKFSTTISPTMLLLVSETNSNEAGEFLTSYMTADLLFSSLGIILLILVTHISCAIYFHYRHLKCHIGITKWIRIIINIAVSVLITVSICLSLYNKETFCKTMSMPTIGKVEQCLDKGRPRLEIYQPIQRLLFAFRCNELIAKQLTRLDTNVGHVKVDSCSVKSPNIVLIIGESSCKRHFQLYGYDKPNNPNQMRMEREGNLIKMDDVVAPWNLTSYVFKFLMTTYCVGDKNEWCDYPLFCEIFRKAGYYVKFFSNQWETKAKQEVYDFSGGFFINNEKLSQAQFDERNSKLHTYDSGLLIDYSESVNRGYKTKSDSMPQLTIFHLIGEHTFYSSRCPKDRKRFKTVEYPNQKDLTNSELRMLADYDNAVRYNDSIVSEIVKKFKKKDAIVIYLSDHGEEVFGPGARHKFGRIHDKEITKRMADEEFRIPMWFYVTNKYKKLHPDVLNAIKAAQKKKYMTDALPHLLMGLAGIHCPYYRPQYDLLSPQYNENRKRILRNSTDYDTLK